MLALLYRDICIARSLRDKSPPPPALAATLSAYTRRLSNSRGCDPNLRTEIYLRHLQGRIDLSLFLPIDYSDDIACAERIPPFISRYLLSFLQVNREASKDMLINFVLRIRETYVGDNF